MSQHPSCLHNSYQGPPNPQPLPPPCLPSATSTRASLGMHPRSRCPASGCKGGGACPGNELLPGCSPGRHTDGHRAPWRPSPRPRMPAADAYTVVSGAVHSAWWGAVKGPPCMQATTPSTDGCRPRCTAARLARFYLSPCVRTQTHELTKVPHSHLLPYSLVGCLVPLLPCVLKQ